jgi:hypothetical protein
LSPYRSWLSVACFVALSATASAAGLPDTVGGPQVAALTAETAPYRVAVPNFHPVFTSYKLTMPAGAGVCAVQASSKGWNRDGYGGAARTAFALVRAQLTSAYGPADEFIDQLRGTSYWTLPQEWVAAMIRKDRVYQAEWHAPAGATFHGNITHIVLAVQAVETDRAFITLQYQFDDAHCRGAPSRG